MTSLGIPLGYTTLTDAQINTIAATDLMTLPTIKKSVNSEA
jgi:hypothetical protein